MSVPPPHTEPSGPMARALELATRGLGQVEPNPMVGAVVTHEGQIVGEGWHERFGGPHAEVNALAAAGERARGATVYVTLEPCSHTGKTPPCARALIDAGVARVVVATTDPFPQVDGRGIAVLRNAGIVCEVGDGEPQSLDLLAPYRKLVQQGRPWVIAKWAMSLDGKIATSSGESQWISGEDSRRWVHTLRGRMDGVLVGAGTLLADDPLLTARPAGHRKATRIILGDDRPLPETRQLFQTASEPDHGPVLLAVGPGYPNEVAQRHEQTGAEVWRYEVPSSPAGPLLDELGRRRMTNLLVEGGGKLLGQMFDQDLVDEVHTFIAPRVIGGSGAASPLGGRGAQRMADVLALETAHHELTGDDLHLWGKVRHP